MTREQIQAMLDGKWLVNKNGSRCYFDENNFSDDPFRVYLTTKGSSFPMRGLWQSDDWEIIDAPKKEYVFSKHEKVLVRNDGNEQWCLALFESFDQYDEFYPFCTTEQTWYIQCIPYEGNEHLLGTTDKE